jgi:uncharacterized BrkB/YihY/UPF0761 family membrane protein
MKRLNLKSLREITLVIAILCFGIMFITLWAVIPFAISMFFFAIFSLVYFINNPNEKAKHLSVGLGIVFFACVLSLIYLWF